MDSPDEDLPDLEALARKILLDQLTGQARSRQELADKLASRKVPDDIAGALLDRFEEVGLVDDESFSRAWVESRHRSRGLAPLALKQELRRKGVADDIIDGALSDVSTESQIESARALVRVRLLRMRGLERDVTVRRLLAMLARKGYGPGLSLQVVKEELGTELMPSSL